MANKRAASAKVTKMPKHATSTKIDDPKEYFLEAIDGIILIIETAQRNCDRIDNLVNAYQEMKSWGIDATIHDAQIICDHMKDDYENALEVVKDINWGDISKKEMKDPILPFIPNRDGIETVEQLYDAYTTWRVLRPIGEKIEQLHSLVIDSIEE